MRCQVYQCLPDQAMDVDKDIEATKTEIAELKDELKNTGDPALKTAILNNLTALRNKENILLQQRQGECLFGGSMPCHHPCPCALCRLCCLCVHRMLTSLLLCAPP